MPANPRLVFINLPVADVAASVEFFKELGFDFNEQFTDASCACLVINDQAYAMLMDTSRFADFATQPVADARSTTEVLVCVSADSRAGVDALADRALDAGGAPAGDAIDHGFMYGRSFKDLDGHHWEVMWMSQEAVEQGPADMAQPA